MFKDYYLILGVSSDATPERIKKAFDDAKAMLNDKTSLAFSQELQEAYAVLSNQEIKARYDKEYKLFDQTVGFVNYVIKDQKLADVINSLQGNTLDKYNVSNSYFETSIEEEKTDGLCFKGENVPKNVVHSSVSNDKTDHSQTMPLVRRFIGSLIDKVVLIVLFAVGFAVISPFGAAGKMGRYVGILTVSPNNYEYIDRIVINNYYNSDYSMSDDGVDPYYKAQKHLANMANPPHIGSTKENDLNITLSFILLNLIYYLFFFFFLCASPFKAVMGGVLLDSNKQKIGIGKVILRAFCGGVFMLIAVFMLHFSMGYSYAVVFVLFFLAMDIPIFFTRQSLLDMCTGTIYAKK